MRLNVARLRLSLALCCALLSGFGVADADEQAQIDFADGLFARGFNDEASEEYRAYLEEYPAGQYRLPALYRLGESEAALGRYEEALEAFDRVLTDGSEGEFASRAQLRKGSVLIKTGRPDDAVKSLQPLVGEASAFELRGEALYFLGRAHVEGGRTASAVAAFLKLATEFSASPFAPMGRYQLAFAYVAQGDLEKAAIEFSEIGAMQEAGDAIRMESYFRAGEAYDKLGWFESAVSTYGRLETEFPGSAYAQRARYGHAWSLYQAGEVAQALEAARDFGAAYPNSAYRPNMAYLAGNCLQETGRYDEALTTYRKLIESYPDSEFAAGARYKAAWAHYFKGDMSTAEQEVETFLTKAEGTGLTGDGLYLKGLILVETEAFSQAVGVFEAIGASYPESEFASDAEFRRGECLVRLGRDAEAAATFTAFASAYPDHPRAPSAHLHAGDAYFDAGNFGEAVASYEHAVEMALPGRTHEEALHRLGTAHHNQGAYAESAAAFGTLLDSYPGGRHAAEANLRTGDYWLREGGEPLKSIAYFEQSSKIAPKGPFGGQALRGLALARYESKDLDGAAQTFVRLIAEWGDVRLNEKTYVWVGQHLFDREEWGQALTTFEALLRNVDGYPNPERVLFKIAQCAEHSDESDEALRQYARVVEAAPGSPSALEARFRMARLYEERDNMKEATALYEEGATTSNGETAARSRFRLGEIYEEKEDYGTAAKHFLRVAILFLHPELSVESLWRAGYCFEQGNDLEHARRTYQEVVEDYPESEQAAKAQARLDALGAQ